MGDYDPLGNPGGSYCCVLTSWGCLSVLTENDASRYPAPSSPFQAGGSYAQYGSASR